MFRSSGGAPFAQPSHPDADRLKKDGVALKDKAIERLTQEADSRKDMVSQGLKSVSSALGAAEGNLSEQGGESPEWLKSGLRQVATSVEQLADRVQDKGSAELIGEVRTFAQNNPGTFLMALRRSASPLPGCSRPATPAATTSPAIQARPRWGASYEPGNRTPHGR